MVKIRNESDLENWFKKNYKKLGFTKILQYNKGKFPDFIVLEGNKKVRIELETKASNFLLHKHPVNKVDMVICVKKDVDLKIPIMELKNLKIVDYATQTQYSFPNQIYPLFKKDKILTTSEVSQKLKINRVTAESGLKELLIDNKIRMIKKKGVTLWILK